MKLNKFMALAVLACVSTPLFNNVSEASALDTYRNLLQKKTYTIKYVDITPQSHVTNSNKIPLYGKSGMDTSKADFLANQRTESIIVADGENRYEEIGAGIVKQCRLIKDGSSYIYSKYHNMQAKTDDGVSSPKGIWEVFGTKKGVISAGQVNLIATAMQGYGYGSWGMTRYLNAIVPNSKKAANEPIFRYVNSGWLNNGLTYEDYSCRQGDVFEAVRYYFKDYALVKIAAARYWTNSKGVMEGTKTIIRINEFSPIPDKTYLELPEGVKVSGKRKK